MKKFKLLFLFVLINSIAFSQAREEEDTGYKKIYTILLLKDGEVKHSIKQGADISARIEGKTVNGRWFFKAYPDVVEIINKKAEVVGQIELNKQSPLRIVTPQPRGGLVGGIGVGPVSVSNAGPSYQTFNMKKYKAEISERMETKEEKMKREYYEKKEQERLAKQAAKQAKKAAKKKK